MCSSNEFKSVIAQRLVVEQILPIEQIGDPAVRMSEEMTEEEKKRAKQAAVSAGAGLHSTEGEAEGASQFGTSQVDYIYEQPPEELFRALAAEVCRNSNFPRTTGVGGRRARRPHDGDGFSDQQCD